MVIIKDPRTGETFPTVERFKERQRGRIIPSGGGRQSQKQIRKQEEFRKRSEEIKAREQVKLIEQQKKDIISRGGRVTTKTSIERGTGARLEIKETRGRGGSLIRESKNLDTGDFRINVFGTGPAGGGVGFKGGVTGVKGKLEEVEKKVEIDIREPQKIILPPSIRSKLTKKNEIFNPELDAFVRPSDPSGQATGFIRQPTASERLAIDKAKIAGSFEGIEVALFPVLVAPKFLDSQLAQQQLRGRVEEDERAEVERTKDLLERSSTLDATRFVDKRKAALELLRLMKNKEREVESDQKRAKVLGSFMDEQKKAMVNLNRAIENRTITTSQAQKRQNEILQRFKNKGFNISGDDGEINISHRTFDRLNRFGGSAWARLLKQARKGDAPIKDQALIASLDFLNKIYKGEKIVLAFQLGGAALTAAGVSAPTLTGSAGSLRLLNLAGKGAAVSIIPSFALLEGVRAKAETGETLLAISSTLGTIAGLGGTGKVISNINLRNKLKSEIDVELKKLSPERREAFKEYMKQTQILQRFEPNARNIKLNNIESITDPKAQRAIRRFLKDNKKKVIVGGSVAQTSQVKVQRKLGDMDLYVEGGLTESQAARNLAKQLKQAGVERVSVIRGQVTIGGKKAIEFHDIERLLTNIRQVTPNFADPRSYIIRTPEGIRIQRIGLQAQRKLIAAFADPKRFATGKYKKDLKDFKSISEKLVSNAERIIKKETFIKSKEGQKFEKLFKREIKTAFGEAVEREFLLKVDGKFRKPPILRNIPKKAFGGERLIKFKDVRKEPLVRTPTAKGVTRRGFPSQSQVRVRGRFRKPPILTPSQSRVKSGFSVQKVPPSQPPVKRSKVPKPIAFTGFRKVPPSQPPVSKPLVFPRVFPSQPPTRRTPGIPRFDFRRKARERQRGRDITIITAPPGKIVKPVKKPVKKNFQVFVRKAGEDQLFRSFGTDTKARTELEKVLSGSLRASGFVVNKQTGVKLKPIIKDPKQFRVGKKDPFRLVERRNKRITKGTPEVTQIQAAKRQAPKKANIIKKNPIKIEKNNPKKPFKNKSNFKSTKLIRRKNNGEK